MFQRSISFIGAEVEQVENRNQEEELKKIEASTKYAFVIPKRREESTRICSIIKTGSIEEIELKMADSELAIILYVANLGLAQRCEAVRTLCEHQLLHMTRASNLFKGNVRKYLALTMLMAE